eukprot:6323827-Amphidinium_carterae.1
MPCWCLASVRARSEAAQIASHVPWLLPMSMQAALVTNLQTWCSWRSVPQGSGVCRQGGPPPRDANRSPDPEDHGLLLRMAMRRGTPLHMWGCHASSIVKMR